MRFHLDINTTPLRLTATTIIIAARPPSSTDQQLFGLTNSDTVGSKLSLGMGIEQMFQNVTISLMSSSQLQYVRSGA